MVNSANGKCVAVVGGSAAGFYAAYLLAQGGARVTLYEASRRLAPTPRSLIVTSAFRDLLGPLAEPAIVNEIDRFELFADGRAAEVKLERPDLIIDRAQLIPTLASAAREAGAELVLGKRFVGLGPNGSGVALRFTARCTISPNGNHDWATHLASGGAEGSSSCEAEESSEVESAGDWQAADVVIGADGAFSSVARAAGFPAQRVVPLVQALVRTPADLDPRCTRVWFEPDVTPYFFWLIPESAERSALGMIGEHAGKSTKEDLDRFARQRGLEILEYQGARIPQYGRWTPVHRRCGGGDVYLVGDAAGQVKVTTVGGIVNGLWGARGVAEAVAKGGRLRSPTLRLLRRELGAHLLVRKSLHGFELNDYRGLVDQLDRVSLRALGTYTRDDTVRLLWNLVRRRPSFLLTAVRGLLKARARF